MSFGGDRGRIDMQKGGLMRVMSARQRWWWCRVRSRSDAPRGVCEHMHTVRPADDVTGRIRYYSCFGLKGRSMHAQVQLDEVEETGSTVPAAARQDGVAREVSDLPKHTQAGTCRKQNSPTGWPCPLWTIHEIKCAPYTRQSNQFIKSPGKTRVHGHAVARDFSNYISNRRKSILRARALGNPTGGRHSASYGCPTESDRTQAMVLVQDGLYSNNKQTILELKAQQSNGTM